jgi:hypothetical protein
MLNNTPIAFLAIAFFVLMFPDATGVGPAFAFLGLVASACFDILNVFTGGDD